jgi:DNA polymerase elongation subunit (family B)
MKFIFKSIKEINLKAMSVIKEMEKNKRPVIVKSFRLIEFRTFDESPMDDTNSDSGSDKEGRAFVKKQDEKQFLIQMYGINEKGETCCLYIHDFQPFFYVKVGKTWKTQDMIEFVNEIKSKLDRKFRDSIVSQELVNFQKLYGFSAGNKDRFVKLTFKNTVVMKKVAGFWYKYDKKTPEDRGERVRTNMIFKNMELELYESNIPPLLRYFHIHNISPSGWVSFKLNRVTKPDIIKTTCKYEYAVSLKELVPMPEKETRVPYNICSFDIEANSSHGDFPLAVKTYKRFAQQMVDSFLKQSKIIDNRDKLNYLISKMILSSFGYDRFEDIDLVYPKKITSKEKVMSLINTLLEKSIENVKISNTEENNDYLLKIDSIFEKMKDFSPDSTVGVDGEETGEVDEAARYGKKWTKQAAVKKSDKLVDILVNDKYDRDEKIQITNDVLTRAFPRLEGDKVTFIGSTFLRYGEKEPYLNHCVVLNSCDPVEGAVIESVDTEKELLLKWTEVIQRENPDIIIGFNTFGFDNEFMFRRAQENECEKEFLLLSRQINELGGSYSYDNPTEMNLEVNKLVVASGEFDMRYFKMSGRIQIDMYAYFRKEGFNFSSYKLDDISADFISDNITKMNSITHKTLGDATELYSQNLMGLHVGDFIRIGYIGFTADYYKDGKKFVVLDIEYGREEKEMVKGEEVTKKYNVILIGGHHQIEKGKSVKWGMAKDDVNHKDIFRLSNGTSSDRAVVAKYCIQDCNLVHHLMNKIDVLTGYIEMANICSVPISFLVFRGQGIKLTSYVAKKCREKNTLMPDLEKTKTEEGYEGAIVLPPKCSMYMDNPVACVDYSSLYPSSMISQNYSHDSLVWSKEYNLSGELIKVIGERDANNNFIYDNMPGYHYIDIDFDTYDYIRKNKTSSAVKTKVGKMVCRWAQFPDNKKGIMPSILEELLKARADTRKMIKTEKDPFMQNILDKRQLSYKVTANSLYGQCGSRTSTFYAKAVAAATTATGRMMIMYAKRMIEEVYGDLVYETVKNGPVKCKAEYVYGDSIASYTPVYVTVNGDTEMMLTVEELAECYGVGGWQPCVEEGKQDKEVCELRGVETWTEKGWTPVFRVIRHALASHKKMIRIFTHTGMVDVTDDHSLITEDGKEISPKDVTPGMVLLHHPPSIPDEQDRGIARDALHKYLMKFRAFKRTCQFVFNVTGVLGTVETEAHIVASLMFQLIHNSGYGYRICPGIGNNIRIVIIDKDHSLYKNHDPKYILHPTGVKTLVGTVSYKYEVPYEGYVYDLTTENHHFAAGVGKMIVHNTDSVFFTFNLEDPNTGEKIRGKPALEMTIELAQDAAILCSQYLKHPMELSYEKTLMPFILLSKKRYVGMLYETDPNKGKLKFMGLSLKRRDSCDYLKDVYGGILKILMDTSSENNIKRAIEYLENALNELVEGRIPMEKLMITKQLKSHYANPNQIAHKVLADRIGKRDPGNKPKPGDRIKFVHFVNQNKNGLQGDKIETPEFIIENNLQIDYNFYITNQLMKPIQQLFGLALEQIWELQNKKTAIKTYQKELEKMQKDFPEMELFMKEKEKNSAKKIKVLLFDKLLTRIANENNRLQSITSFFTKK